jgi:hypothetical protein
MIYYAHCRACDTRWQVVPPRSKPLDLSTALDLMEAALCPECGNDGARAPVHWRFRFPDDAGMTRGCVRPKGPARPNSASRRERVEDGPPQGTAPSD